MKGRTERGRKERERSSLSCVTIYGLRLTAVAITTNKAAVFVWISCQSVRQVRWRKSVMLFTLRYSSVAPFCGDPEVRRANKKPPGLCSVFLRSLSHPLGSYSPQGPLALVPLRWSVLLISSSDQSVNFSSRKGWTLPTLSIVRICCFSVLCDGKLNIFWIWTVGRTKQET